MSDVLVAAIWAGCLLWWMPMVWARLDRYLTLLEKRAERPVLAKMQDPIPVDLLMGARERYSERWAQDQAVESLHDLRGQLGSWDEVRQAVAAGGF